MNKNNLKWQLPFLVLLIVGTVLILRKQSPYQTDQGLVFGTVYKITYQSSENLKEEIEKELQKVHLKKSTALNDIGKTVWDTKKIRELLDQDAELEEIKRFFDENQLKPDQYNRNAIPLAAYTYWYGRGCGREDVCLWALESATTIDGLLQVQEPSHMEEIAKL